MNNLKNTYFVIRHGESKANVEGIIISDLERGQLDDYSLSEKGKEEVENSASSFKENDFVILSSPFSRCLETANIFKKGEVIVDERLRERYFGDFEGKENSNYQKVWEEDKKDPSHKNFGVESVLEVLERMLSVISDLEKKYENRAILLVSHGDPLQILQTWFEDIPSSLHREIDHLKTAEIRKLS